MLRRALVPLALLLAFSRSPAADVRLPAILGDGIVLQREAEVQLWGWADPGEEVQVAASWGVRAATTADDEGRWRVGIGTPEAGGPYEIDFAGEDDVITLADVLIGEVWICSGQSNMEWTLGPGVGSGIANWEEEVGSAYYAQIRLFDVPNTIALEPAEDCGGSWEVCSPETVSTFSAVGYLFGRELADELGVPIGLVSTNWGGTVAEAWTSREGLAGFPEFADDLAKIERAARDPEGAAAAFEADWRAWWEALAQKDPLSREGRWMEARYALDDSWGKLDLPALWEGELGDYDGIVWFCRELELPAEFAYQDLELDLGPIDDMDSVWFNGVKVGGIEEGGNHRTPRVYTVPAKVPRIEHNLIAVRVLDTGGAGGFSGAPEDMRIGPKGTDQRIPLAGTWHYQLGASIRELGQPPSRSWMHQNRPTALYNGMLAPLTPLRIRGVIWYQGESNVGRAAQYRRLFPAMIADWRRSFHAYGQGEFPFYWVQIAPWSYGNDTGQAAELREAQTLALQVPNTGMAVTMDIGDPGNIHPANKQDVGKRLALLALAKTYGREGLECSGPMYRGMTVEGPAIRLAFDHAAGLTSHGEELQHFTIAGADRVFHPAVATIDGEEVVVRSADVLEPVAVRFGWGAADITNLWNGAGLPAPSFRTDDWSRE